MDLQTHVLNELNSHGHLALSFYPEFAVADRPPSGIKDDVLPPRFSHAYWGERNRIGMLIETHSWKDYATRVDATLASMVAVLERTGQHGTNFRVNADQADVDDARCGDDTVVLVYEPSATGRMIDFKGYAYRQELSPVSGSVRIEYLPNEPQVWQIPFYDDLQPAVVIRPPRVGYFVPSAHSQWLGEKLRLHRVEWEEVETSKTMDVEVFRAESFELSKETSEGRTPLKIKGSWTFEQREIAKGSLFVPICQTRSRMVLHLLEPTAPDSFLHWGFFNSHYERKEYLEPYVAEQFAAELLTTDETIRTRFQMLIQQDPTFAADAKRRLDFFYQLHPSWDERFALYPIFRA